MPRTLPVRGQPARAPAVGLDDTGPAPAGAQAIGHAVTARIAELTGDAAPPRPAAGRSRRGEPLHLSPGMVIPGTRYRLIRWLGDGGMGVVYEACHIDIDRRVAIKVLRPEVCAHPQALRLFRDEARAAARIGSSYIVEIVDFAELPDGRLLYAMELLAGRPLARALAERPLPPARALAILRQLCKGLAAAHAAHVVHRDIKPDNIFLEDRQSRRDAVKILDFGLSVFMVEATATDADIVGTPMYLAPELVAGQPFDARVDMYAVGCTAYEMLTGHPPYAGSIRELLHAHVHAPAPSAEALQRDHDVPLELAEVVVRCLAKRPEDRYADMNDLEAALCEAQIAAGVETPWDDLPLPDVDGERRDLLLRRMPDPTLVSAVLPRTRRSAIAAIFAACLLTFAAAAILSRTLAAPAADVDPALARLEAEARAAAARVAFVYPPADDPQATTAYQVIHALEASSGPHTRAAHELAGRLRREFAGTLGAFGDRLWDRPGGLEFAVDAYAQALLFDPDLEPAAARAALTPGQLARLAAKAATHDFSATELIAVEPLVVLAHETLPATPELAAARDRVARRVRTRGPTPSAAAEPTPPPVAAATPATPATPDAKRPSRDPSAAARAVEAARAALRDGRLADAESTFERALGHDNHSVAALVGLTELYFNRGAYARALGFGERALKLAADDPALHLLVGDAAFKVFRFADARAAYERAGKLGHPEAGQRLAKLTGKLAR